ncbi:MAG: hypothetical protein PHY72_03190 [Candidatus Pacebacteria bacterium]|nr:hypothetical protein [Candidatus Paceibacterota bacterium]
MTINKEQFLVSITTIGDNLASSWQDKLQEATKLGLKKVAIFLTCLKEPQRKDFYTLLENSSIKEAPFVHIRSDMSAKELDYLQNKFKTQVFNTHTARQHPPLHDLKDYREHLFIENTWPWDEQEVKKFAGLCLDMGHLYDAKKLRPNDYENNLKIIAKYPIGCNHISAVGKEVVYFESEQGEKPFYSSHFFTDLLQFDYLKNYPAEFFSNFCAIEVENSLSEQLTAIDYIVSLLDGV